MDLGIYKLLNATHARARMRAHTRMHCQIPPDIDHRYPQCVHECADIHADRHPHNLRGCAPGKCAHRHAHTHTHTRASMRVRAHTQSERETPLCGPTDDDNNRGGL